jgi:aspartyl aminopeptidase
MTAFDLQGLLRFLGASPSPFHAVKNLCEMFAGAGFNRLDERAVWKLQAGEAYFYTRSDASIVAFRMGSDVSENGLRIVGAHTDSPCLKLKPQPELNRNNYSMLGVEVYGGALLNPWFDRDLGLAGKVTGLNTSGDLVSALVNFDTPIAYIPSLAIHLNREANSNKTVNPQKEMNALLSLSEGDRSFMDVLLERVKSENPNLDFDSLLNFNLSFYDLQAPAIIGLSDEFIASARLDNLLSCFLGAQSLIDSDKQQSAVLICNDHEEVGSRSDVGAQGTMLNDLISRLCPDPIDRQRCVRHSMMFSVDNAHGIHPNYPDRHDASHGPMLNSGPVIKFDADQSYATSPETAALVRVLAQADPELPLQEFVTRADMRCGSTIGPITAANTGVKTVDLGNPQFAMHSCRELAGAQDCGTMHSLLTRFLNVSKIPF